MLIKDFLHNSWLINYGLLNIMNLIFDEIAMQLVSELIQYDPNVMLMN